MGPLVPRGAALSKDFRKFSMIHNDVDHHYDFVHHYEVDHHYDFDHFHLQGRVTRCGGS